MGLARYSWMLRFEHINGGQPEETYFNSEEEARDILRLFDEPDSSEIYTGIDLIEVDWHTRSERVLDSLTLDPYK
jgi:hypothetical protein